MEVGIDVAYQANSYIPIVPNTSLIQQCCFVVLVNCHFLIYYLAEIVMILLILAGDVETNPGPLTGTCIHVYFMYN